jgi:hypothetical protein
VPTQHWHAPAELHDAVPRRHALQLDGTQLPPPLEDVDEPLLELEVDPATHAPALHDPPLAVQSVHVAPPMPHIVSWFCWQVPVPSQQPFGQFEAQSPPPLELVELPPSSPLSSPELV